MEGNGANRGEREIDALKRRKIAEVRTAGADAVLSAIFAEHSARPLFRNEGYKKIALAFAWENGDLLLLTLYKAWTAEWLGTFPRFLERIEEGATRDEAEAAAQSLGLKAEKSSLLTTRKGAVEKCDFRAERISVPEGVRKLGNRAFRSCKSLSFVRIPGSVDGISPIAFDGCASLAQIEVAEENPSYKTEGGLLLTRDGRSLVRCPQRTGGRVAIPDGVETIERRAFAEASLTEAVIPRSCRTIRREAFLRARSLKSVRFLGTVAEWDEVLREECWSYMTAADFVECADGRGMC